MLPVIHDADWNRVPDRIAHQYRSAGLWTDDLLGDLARHHATAAPTSLAVVDARHRWTYERLEGEAMALAAGWLRRGVGPGVTVLVQLPNCAEFVAILLSLWKVGAVPVMALPAHRLSELGAFAAQARIGVYVSAERIGDLDQISAGDRLRLVHPDLIHVVVPTTEGGTGDTAQDAEGVHRRETYDGLRADPAEAARLPDVDPFGVALLQLSGGSTGTPKLIPRTHADYLCSVRGSVPLCGITSESVYLCALPSAHNFAMSSAGVLGQLLAGGSIVMAPDPSPATVFPLITAESVTITGVVPPIALLWLAAAAKSRRGGADPLASLQVLQVGGARLSEEIARRIEPELGVRLQQVFGMAEGLVNYTRLDDSAEVVVATQGRPLSAADEVRIIDEADEEVPDGMPGHLLARGPYTIRGYFRAPEHNDRAFTDEGFYRTGDIVVRTREGNLSVVGRAKDQINRGGEKIASEELENHLLAHPTVFEVAVVGEPDPMLGERIVAHVIAADGEDAARWRALPQTRLTQELRAFLAARELAAYKLPDRVELVEQLPRTAVGKTSAARLRDTAETR